VTDDKPPSLWGSRSGQPPRPRFARETAPLPPAPQKNRSGRPTSKLVGAPAPFASQTCQPNPITCWDPGKCVAQNPTRRFARLASHRFSRLEQFCEPISVSFQNWFVRFSGRVHQIIFPRPPFGVLSGAANTLFRRGRPHPNYLIRSTLIRARIEPGLLLPGSNRGPNWPPF
jgi:hypothetical protein